MTKTKCHCRRLLSLFLTALVILSMFPAGVFAGQDDEYRDPAIHWRDASNRTNELDANAVVTHETFPCFACGISGSFTVWRTPEYTRDGQTALSRNIAYSDGTLASGDGSGNILDGTPNVDATYTGYHWTKAYCETCGTMNGNLNEASYGFGKNVYWLYDCAVQFQEELDETVSYEYTDSVYHTKTVRGGTYCGFCYGTRYRENSSLEPHNMVRTIEPQIAHNRFVITDRCSLCDYSTVFYVIAKTVVADYYGTVDGLPHTLSLTDLSEASVTTSIRYGETADTCDSLTPMSYSQAGNYTVYYAATYSYGGESMTENGVAYVRLREESTGNCACGCGDNDCGCSSGSCDGNCHPSHEIHNFTLLEIVAPTCGTLGYERYLCIECGCIEKRNYIAALDHAYVTLSVIEASCQRAGQILEQCSRCGDVRVITTPRGEHRYVTSTVPATCTAPGYTLRICSVCGERTITEMMPLREHSYVSSTVPATCLTGGSITEICSVCGQVGAVRYLPATGHDWDGGTVLSTASCLANGVTVFTCRLCRSQRYETTPATGHVPGPAATCTVPQLCTVCGAVIQEAIGHNFTSSVTAPTCISMGFTVFTCATCGETYQGDYRDALGHSYVSEVTPATCTTQGFTTYTCTRCGDSYVSDYAAPLGHHWDAGTEIVGSTCNNSGFLEHHCVNCGATYLESLGPTGHRAGAAATCTTPQVCTACGAVLVQPLGHSYRTTVTEATCTQRGYTTYTCARCGDSYIGNYTQPLGHSYRANVTAPTCTDRGYTSYVCSRCGDSYAGDYTAARNHDWDNGTVITVATCLTVGVTEYRCRNCSATRIVTTPTTGHTPGPAATCTQPQVCTVCNTVISGTREHNWTADTTPATCTAMGFTTYTCSLCGSSYRGDYLNALGHSYVRETVSATCTAGGYTVNTCSRCGDNYRDAYTSPTGHSLDRGTVLIAPSCDHEGVRQYRCNHCDYTELETIPATGHTPGPAATCSTPQVCTACGTVLQETSGHVYRSEVTAPTCTTMGYTTYTCTTCGDSYRADYRDSLGHSWDSVTELVSSSCNSQGIRQHRCTRCGDTWLESVSATGHTPGAAATCTEPQVCTVCNAVLVQAAGHSFNTDVTPASCAERGYTTHTCGRCGYSYKDSYTSPAGHRWNSGVTLASPTCVSRGVTEYRCMNCVASYTVTSPAIDHTPGPAATCTAPQLCTTCGAVLENALEHNWRTETTPPTCTALGYTAYTCTNCDVTFRTDYVEAIGHSYTQAVTAPTCTAGGYTLNTCSVCGDIFYSDHTQPTGHSLDNGTVISEAACGHSGVRQYRCGNCDYNEVRTIPALEHVPGPEADCMNPQVCIVCGAVLAAATGHQMRTVTTAPTCTDMGYTVYSCDGCDLTYRSDYVAALGHTYVPSVTPATCTAGGYTVYTCSDCGDSYTGDYTAALGHSWDTGTRLVNSTCNGQGMTEYKCVRCEAHYLEALSAEGHTPGPAATCTEAQLCSVCGAVLAQPAGHDFRRTAAAPTCTGPGYLSFTCVNCGWGYVSDYVSPLGHDYVASITPASCEDGGFTTFLCSRCGDGYVDRYTTALGHSWDNGTALVEATCGGGGVIDHACSRCAAHYLEPVDPLAHTPGPAATCTDPQICTVCGAVLELAHGHDMRAEVIAPTCLDGGFTRNRCAVCGLTYEQNRTRANGHHYLGVVTPADCYQGGFTTYTCDVCGDSYVSDYTAVLGHDWDSGTLLITSTCNGEGMLDHSCRRCGAHYLEAVSADGHVPGAAATCTDPQVCTVCGAVLAFAAGHEMRLTPHPATCTEAGYVNYACTRCGWTYNSDYVLPNGHDYRDTVIAPTCGAGGFTTHTCAVCGDSYVDNPTDALDHEWNAGTVVIEATCSGGGMIDHRCVRCGEPWLEAVDALPHTPGPEATCTDSQLCRGCGVVLALATGHKFQSEITPATCTEYGYTTFTCESCGMTYQNDYVQALGHNYSPTVLSPGCSEPGFTIWYCEACGDAYVGDYVEPLGHEWDEGVELIESSCNGAGMLEHRCVRCDYHYLEPLSAEGHSPGTPADCLAPQLCEVCGAVLELPLGHDLQTVEHPAACTEQGFTTYTCSRCGWFCTSDYVLPLGHDYTTEVTAATCTTDGYTTYTCSRCGDSYTDERTAALGHGWDTGTVILEATCAGGGMLQHNCSRCDASYLEATAPIGHIPGPEATCTEAQICSVCGAVLTQPLGHDLIVEIIAPTCEEGGYTSYRCGRCGFAYERNYTRETGHNYVAYVTPPTCVADGFTTYICSNCGESYTSDQTAALGHEWDEGKLLVSSSCNGEGMMEYRCVRCDYHYLEAVSGDGHVPGPEATCTEAQVCTVCGAVLAQPTGHDLRSVPHPASCTESGYTSVTCKNCDWSYNTDYILPTGHDYVPAIVEATCTEGGYTVNTCSHCGETYVDNYTQPLGHEWDAGTVLLEATCSGGGMLQHNCVRCDKQYLEAVEPLPHTPGPDATCTEPQLCTGCGVVLNLATGHNFRKEITPAGCAEEGFTTYTCVNCGMGFHNDYVRELGHDYVPAVTAPGCTEQGYTLWTCSRCGDSYIGDFTDPLGHEWDKGTLVIGTSCNSDGMIDHRCVRCDYHYLEPLSADGHTPGPAATCLNPQTCTVCGAVLAFATGHEFQTMEIPASCTDAGYTTYTCSHCGWSYSSDYVLPLGHDYKEQVTAPECTRAGYTAYICARCGTGHVDDYVEALGHEWDAGTVVIEPACVSGGMIDHRCVRCDYHYLEATAPTGHTPGEAATCTEAQICSVCGAVLTQPLGHDIRVEVLSPTCDRGGYTSYRCLRCGLEYERNYTEKTGHNYVAYVTEADCYNPGYTTYVCSDCGDSYESDHVDALGHEWNEGRLVIATTCGGQGMIEYRCLRCGYVYLEAVSAEGHIPGPEATCTEAQVCTVCGAVLTQPTGHRMEAIPHPVTCTEAGFVSYACANCGWSYNSDYVLPVGHEYEATVVEATCDEGGHTVHTCVRCGDSYVDENTPALGHKWDTGTVIIEATCSGGGMIDRHCIRCGVQYLESVDALPHTPGEGPTCTEPQLCEVCGVVLAQAKGHRIREEVRPASCTEGGFTTFRCPDCGLTYRSDYTRELGHNYQPEVFAPNCTEGGFTVWTCENCGDSYTGDYVEPLGHEWDEGTPVISTSCNGEGMIDHRCLRCDYHYLEAVSAEGHSPGPEATCTEAQICEVCGAVLRQPAGHSMKSETHPATCTEMGYTEFACEFCGYGYKSDYTLPVGHDYVSVTTEATCTESGRITVTCSRCGDSYEDGGIEPLGHEWDEGTEVIKPTCNSEGMIDHRCVRCDYHYLEAVEPLGHVAGVEATCVDPQVCTVCGAVLELARGHDIQVEVIAPTCTNGGYTSYRCRNCDLAYERSYTKELGHYYIGFVTAPDCYAPGYTTYVCANCGDSYVSDHVEALGHEWNEGILVISASCNGEGMIDHRCVRCDYHYLEAVSAEGHTPGTEATCTEPQLCTVCGAVLALPLGHSYASEVTAPTCTAMGFTAYTCSRCGDSYRSAYVEATGHRVSDWIVDREPTQDAEGSRHKECVVCHTLLETETLDKLAVSAITDTRGEAVVGAYLVIVTDTESGTPVMGATVLLSGDRRIQVKLPDGRLVDYGKQTTVGVYMNSDRTPVPGITVTLTDGYDNISIGITDKNGTVTLPAANGTTNPEGRITIGYVDGRGNRGTITVRLIDFESGRPIPGAVLTVKNGKLLVMLPEGTDLDEADRITVIVYDNRKQPVANLEVTVTNDLGASETGFTDEDGTLTLPGTVQTERHTAYVNGYPDGSFGPEYGMTRAEATAIFARILAAKNGDTISDGAVKFTDVPDGAWYKGYVAYLTRHGIVNGTSETEFSPDREIIRAEFVALAVRFFEVYDGGNVEVINEYIPFNDVSASYWAAEYIHDAAVFGWIKGYEDGSFRAGNRITRAEVVTIVNRVLGHAADRTYVNENGGRLTTFNDVVRNHWAFYDIMEAANTHNAVLGKTETWSK